MDGNSASVQQAENNLAETYKPYTNIDFDFVAEYRATRISRVAANPRACTPGELAS